MHLDSKTSTSSGLGRIVLPSALGLVAGVAGSLLASHLSTQDAVSVPVATAAAASERRARTVEPALAGQLPASEEAESSEVPPPAAGSAIAQEPTNPPQTLEESRRYHENRHQKALDEHRNEPRDPAWAGPAESKFFGDLRAVAEQGHFTIQEVSCKTTTCVATAKWNSFDLAEQHYGSILHARYQVNCAKEILLPDPELPSGQYQASVIFDCQQARAEGAL